ncbi:arf-GAP domain and FG repeat-containing protein 1-like [Daphnia pulicaria]|uniref:arf-GAP domain and FG repeat-containing protein 1-like n=1 Tax=Daphnia pulicaria TaxID=35523 RepID=UPI001EEA9682|nr:arf-GAP domain and FG repeat-containing protein 1-like [Daphnia pulicaria]XP_046648635.1 arf-GAP domain and FG repeat-containing protein 1-like [Daphnia pulicaria]
MSNNTKKKQEEKHLKILREFLSLSTNKTCFDCNQRGPTYVNTTIGSFVCISCSGKLRGLTPPHRVKSISMASFTPEEIDFLKSRGNEYCKLVWMAHYNAAELSSETKDEQKFKDHLVAKYEKKRWYADPSTLTDRLPAAKLNGVNGESSQPVQAHPSTVTSSPVARPVVSAIPSVPLSSVPLSKTSDLLADLDFFVPAVPSAGSAFSSPRKNHSSIPQSVSQPSFANFQNADFFFSETSPQKTIAAPAAVTHQVQSGAVNGMASPLKVGASNGVAAPTEDRYSALKDLDALFTTQTTPISEPSVSAAANWNPSWNTGTAQAATAAPPTHLHHHSESVFSSHNNAAAAAVAVETPVAWSSFTPSNSSNPSNPFLAVASVPTQPGTQPVHYGKPALPWANFSSSPLSGSPNMTSGTNVAFPAASAAAAAAAANSHFAFGFGGHPNPMVSVATTLTTSQSLDLSPKTWGTSTGMNPFMDATSFTQGRSHNPFL